MPKGVRFGGRQKGTPNKRTQEAAALAERLQVDPLEILLLFAKGDAVMLGYAQGWKPGEPLPVIDPALRVKAAAEAVKYLYSQKRELQMPEEGLKIIIEDYRKA